ncbi:hypothetical protein GCM10010124_31620 [Pilimelia terevasa]|uniref:Uncharacterized protein n=1 Tax=Pilimelia terevasa TaxID=53372 RepID=A0A8J3FK47_9ACTN|nr:hypothetical protein [Pilimelia terevasa]GGK36652.1 hypothetical protein GCM10010124_31620 [Pilimelia terevasa]
MSTHSFTAGDYAVLDRSVSDSLGEVYEITGVAAGLLTGRPIGGGIELDAQVHLWQPADPALVADAQRMAAGGFANGDLVVLAPYYTRRTTAGVVYRVNEIDGGKKSVRATSVVGGRVIRADFDGWRLAPADLAAAALAKASASGADPAAVVEGAVVTIAGRGWKQPAGQLFVVTRRAGDEKVRVARLGGDGGRYWPSVPLAFVTVVAPPAALVVGATVWVMHYYQRPEVPEQTLHASADSAYAAMAKIARDRWAKAGTECPELAAQPPADPQELIQAYFGRTNADDFAHVEEQTVSA